MMKYLFEGNNRIRKWGADLFEKNQNVSFVKLQGKQP